ncbi:hypothetical protein B0H13DRAFT_2552759 [Mycena leptocephala]|nr:hypothetical protein B0H13DRAFT_2552759 [Mycena leptocephala]
MEILALDAEKAYGERRISDATFTGDGPPAPPQKPAATHNLYRRLGARYNSSGFPSTAFRVLHPLEISENVAGKLTGKCAKRRRDPGLSVLEPIDPPIRIFRRNAARTSPTRSLALDISRRGGAELDTITINISSSNVPAPPFPARRPAMSPPARDYRVHNAVVLPVLDHRAATSLPASASASSRRASIAFALTCHLPCGVQHAPDEQRIRHPVARRTGLDDPCSTGLMT